MINELFGKKITYLGFLFFVLSIVTATVQLGCGGSNGGSTGGSGGGSEPPPSPPSDPTLEPEPEQEITSQLLQSLGGYFSFSESDTYRGCEYGVCGSDISSTRGELLLDTHNKFIMCYWSSSLSSTTIPTGDGSISDSSANSGFWCAYGAYEAVLQDEYGNRWSEENDVLPIRVSIHLTLERCLDDNDSLSCYDENLSETQSSNFYNGSLVYNLESGLTITYAEDELAILEIYGWNRDNNLLSSFFDQNYRNILSLGVEFNETNYDISVYKPCVTNLQREFRGTGEWSATDGTYFTFEGTGFYGFEFSGVKGETWHFYPYTPAGDGVALAVFPSDAGPELTTNDYIALEEAYDVSCEACGAGGIFYEFFMSLLYTDPVSGVIDEYFMDEDTSSYYETGFVSITYVVPETRTYDVLFRNTEGETGDPSYEINHRDKFRIDYWSEY